MRALILTAMLAALALSTRPASAQGVTATCRDGTTFNGTTRQGACARPRRGPGVRHGNAVGAIHANTGRACSAVAVGRRPGAGVGKHEVKGLPLPRRPLLREDEAGCLHDRGRRQGRRRPAGPR